MPDYITVINPLLGTKECFGKNFPEDYYYEFEWDKNSFWGTSPYELILTESFIDWTEGRFFEGSFENKSLIKSWIGCNGLSACYAISDEVCS